MKNKIITLFMFMALMGCKFIENPDIYTDFPENVNLNAVEMVLSIPLGNPNEILVLENVYVIKDDKADFFLHFFNQNNHNHLGSFIRKGNGPLEETLIQSLSHADGNNLIFKTQEGLTRIAFDISSNKNNLIDTWDVPIDFLTVAYPLDSSKVLGWNYSMHSSEFLIYDPLADAFTDFGNGFNFSEPKLTLEESHRIFGNKQMTVKSDGRYFATSYMALPLIRIFDVNNGKLVHEMISKHNYDFPHALLNRNASREEMQQVNENYYRITSTDNYIYALFSGKTKGELYPGMLSGEFTVPDFGNEIHVWDWSGKPIKKIGLDRSIFSFDVSKDDGLLLAISVNNPGKVYTYILE